MSKTGKPTGPISKQDTKVTDNKKPSDVNITRSHGNQPPPQPKKSGK